MKLTKNNIFQISAVIVTHVYATGPAFFLEDYLVRHKSKKLLFIGLPFSYAKDKCPFYRYYENGRLVEQKKVAYRPMPDVLGYIRDIYLTISWVVPKGRFDLFIGVDNLNTFTGLFMRLFGRVQKVIFYTIDYVPQRFSNVVVNTIYHMIEKLAVYHSNAVWNLSYQMLIEREKRGYNKTLRKKQMVVPIGTEPIPMLPRISRKNQKTLVFMGHLREGQGVEFLINSFRALHKALPGIRLIIVGGGALEQQLKNIVQSQNIENFVTFTGFIKDFSEVKKILRQASIAIAPYADTKKSFTRYTDPGKIKDYLSQGLPVIVTRVPKIADEIQQKKAGVAIHNTEKELVKAVKTILSDEQILQTYRHNALQMAKEYTWEQIFTKALIQTAQL